MKRVAELSGALLDYWVARALGWEAKIHTLDNGKKVVCPIRNLEARSGIFAPSSDWADGGPIIEREKIALWANRRGKWCIPEIDDHEVRDIMYESNSPLEAAMRCYVASKFGEEVPDD